MSWRSLKHVFVDGVRLSATRGPISLYSPFHYHYPSKLQWLPQLMTATLMLQMLNYPRGNQNPKQNRQSDRVSNLVLRRVRRRTVKSMRSRGFWTRKGALRARCAQTFLERSASNYSLQRQGLATSLSGKDIRTRRIAGLMSEMPRK